MTSPLTLSEIAAYGPARRAEHRRLPKLADALDQLDMDTERGTVSPSWRSGSRNRDGRAYINVNIDGPDGETYIGAHRLIASAALGFWIPAALEVDHLNHDPSDNRAANLEIVTKATNHERRRAPLASLSPRRVHVTEATNYQKRVLAQWHAKDEERRRADREERDAALAERNARYAERDAQHAARLAERAAKDRAAYETYERHLAQQITDDYRRIFAEEYRHARSFLSVNSARDRAESKTRDRMRERYPHRFS